MQPIGILAVIVAIVGFLAALALSAPGTRMQMRHERRLHRRLLARLGEQLRELGRSATDRLRPAGEVPLITLQRRAANAAVGASLVHQDGVLLPDDVAVKLHPDDFRRAQIIGSAFGNGIADLLVEIADRHGLVLNARPRVSCEACADVPLGRPRVVGHVVGETVMPTRTLSRPEPSRATTIRVTTPTQAEEHTLQRRASYVGGRSPRCDVVVDEAGVSREHVRITVDDAGTVVVEDLDSLNGTYVGGVRLGAGRRVPWPPGTALGLGHKVTCELVAVGPTYETAESTW